MQLYYIKHMTEHYLVNKIYMLVKRKTRLGLLPFHKILLSALNHQHEALLGTMVQGLKVFG